MLLKHVPVISFWNKLLAHILVRRCQNECDTLNVIWGQIPDNAKPMSRRMRSLCQYSSAKPMSKRVPDNAKPMSRRMRSRCQYWSANPMSKRILDNAKPMSKRMRSRCQDTLESSQDLLNFYLNLN